MFMLVVVKAVQLVNLLIEITRSQTTLEMYFYLKRLVGDIKNQCVFIIALGAENLTSGLETGLVFCEVSEDKLPKSFSLMHWWLYCSGLWNALQQGTDMNLNPGSTPLLVVKVNHNSWDLIFQIVILKTCIPCCKLLRFKNIFEVS